MAITKSFTGSAAQTPSQTVYTFSSQALGTAASDRYIVVGTLARAAAARTLDSVTVGGVAATKLTALENAGSNSGLWLAAVPTGTTGDVVLTFSSTMVRAAIAIWRVDGISTTPTDVDTSDALPATANITIAAGGVAFGASFVGINTTTLTATWTNLTTDADYLTSASWEDNGRGSFASDAFGSAQTELALTCTWNNTPTGQTASFASLAPAGGGGPTYTLTAAAGALTLTGNAAALTAQRKVTAGASSFALTGNAAALSAQRKIALDAGAYTLTGNAAALFFQHNLVPLPASYALTGNDATLTYTPRTLLLTAEAGSFALTGNAAGLSFQHSLVPLAGSYALTGSAANLVYTPIGGPTHTLSAEAGAFALTGNAAGLSAQRNLSADAGAYALTGNAAALTYTPRTLVLTALAGTLNLTGNAATLTYSPVGGVPVLGSLVGSTRKDFIGRPAARSTLARTARPTLRR